MRTWTIRVMILCNFLSSFWRKMAMLKGGQLVSRAHPAEVKQIGGLLDMSDRETKEHFVASAAFLMTEAKPAVESLRRYVVCRICQMGNPWLLQHS
ncbi:hypothetical protein XELAEV_18002988mg [Xenopus laevis]|nr:hypothetical protein XELAEV_18002988mg [Xenopus laevis]